MKKNGYLVAALTICLFLFAACTKPAEAKKSTEQLVNALVYQKELGKVEELFQIDGKILGENAETHFIENMKKEMDLDESYDERLQGLSTKMADNLTKHTSFKTKILKETKGKAEVELSITGLTDIDDDKMSSVLDSELNKRMESITAETTDKEINKMINDISIDTLSTLLSEQKPMDKVTIVKLDLMADADNKSKWIVQNQDTFVAELFEAFGQ